MAKQAWQLVREAVFEYGLAHSIHHPDDLAETSRPSGPGNGPSKRLKQPVETYIEGGLLSFA